MNQRTWLVVGLLALGASPLTALAQQTLQGKALVAALQQGGYVIVMRHAMTGTKPDAAKVDVGNCATQRNLSPEGRAQARSIGSSVDALRIPIGSVTTSPFCRTEDTAALAFGRYDANAALAERPAKTPAMATDAAQGLRPLVAAVPPPGTNAIVVTHGFNIKSVLGESFAMGEAAVLKPDGKGGFVLVARILPQDWATLGR